MKSVSKSAASVAAASAKKPARAGAEHKPAAASKPSTLKRALPWILLIIAVDEFKLLQNPAFKPNCDLNPIISCGSVMQSKQAHAFGFSNPFIGLMAFPVLITLGAMLLSGSKEQKRWFWLSLTAGTLFGVGFVHWLFFETVYRIHSLCPYCTVVWIVTITTFWYTTLYNIEAGFIKLPAKLSKPSAFIRKHHLDILVFWLLAIAALILKHFWYYYGRNFHL